MANLRDNCAIFIDKAAAAVYILRNLEIM